MAKCYVVMADQLVAGWQIPSARPVGVFNRREDAVRFLAAKRSKARRRHYFLSIADREPKL